jgi:hypothetical protein
MSGELPEASPKSTIRFRPAGRAQSIDPFHHDNRRTPKMKSSTALGWTCAAALACMALPAIVWACDGAASATNHPSGAKPSASQANVDPVEASLRDFARATARRGDARSLLIAAMILPQYPTADPKCNEAVTLEAAAWIERAMARDGDDPLVAWMGASRCFSSVHPCDRAAAARRMLQLEPDNAAAHLFAFSTAYHDEKDVPAAIAHVRAAARLKRFDDHYRDVLVLLDRTLQGWSPPAAAAGKAEANWKPGLSRPGTPDGQRAIQVLIQASIYRVGVSGRPSAVCLPNHKPTTDSALRQACREVYLKLADDPGSATSQIRAAQLYSELLDEGPERAAARERYRKLAWIEYRFLKLASVEESSPDRDYIASIERGGESAAMSKALLAYGIGNEPPKEWRPDKE